jgi:hypothetical protein
MWGYSQMIKFIDSITFGKGAFLTFEFSDEKYMFATSQKIIYYYYFSDWLFQGVLTKDCAV